jgi:hypothetical protein
MVSQNLRAFAQRFVQDSSIILPAQSLVNVLDLLLILLLDI